MELNSWKNFKNKNLINKEVEKLKLYIKTVYPDNNINKDILRRIITKYEKDKLLEYDLNIRINIIENTYKYYDIEFFTDVNFNNLESKLKKLLKFTYESIYDDGCLEKKDLTKKIIFQLEIELQRSEFNLININEKKLLKQICFKYIFNSFMEKCKDLPENVIFTK
jgi:hypothetical protein